MTHHCARNMNVASQTTFWTAVSHVEEMDFSTRLQLQMLRSSPSEFLFLEAHLPSYHLHHTIKEPSWTFHALIGMVHPWPARDLVRKNFEQILSLILSLVWRLVRPWVCVTFFSKHFRHSSSVFWAYRYENHILFDALCSQRWIRPLNAYWEFSSSKEKEWWQRIMCGLLFLAVASCYPWSWGM